MPFPSFPYPLFTASFLACIQFSPPLISLQFVPFLIYSRGPSSTPSRQYFTPRGTDSSLNLLIALLLPSSSLSPPLVSYHTLILISSSFSPSLPLRWTLVGPQRSSSLQCRVSEGCSFLPLQEAPLVISSPLPASHSQPDVLLDIHIDILHTQELPVLMCWYGTSSSIISPGATFGYFAMGWCWWEFLSSGMVTFRKLNFAPKRDFIFIFILTWKVTKSYCEASGCICPHYISSFKDRHEYGVIWLWVKHLQKLIISSFPKWGPRPPGGSQ